MNSNLSGAPSQIIIMELISLKTLDNGWTEFEISLETLMRIHGVNIAFSGLLSPSTNRRAPTDILIQPLDHQNHRFDRPVQSRLNKIH